MTGVQVDVEVLEALEFQPGCEGPNHHKAKWGHIPEQPASWLVMSPCGTTDLMCDGWVQDVLDYYEVVCSCAAEAHPVHTIRFIPIGTP